MTMTKLPATYIEAEALAFTRDRIARMQTGDFIELGVAPLDPRAGRAFWRRLLKDHALSGSPQMFDVKHAAMAGDVDADAVCRDLIDDFTNRHEPLPAYLADYNAHLVKGLLPRRHRARKKASNLLQDIVFVATIMELLARFPTLKATRDQKQKARPACSIVAIVAAEAGLHRGGEMAMVKIWRRYKDAVLPGWLLRPASMIL
jgi:hypothetical protein